MESDKQGVVHIIGPEQGITLPGTTVVCGDSHTATHGAFGAIAFGIGTSEVEHVLATQTLRQKMPKQYKVEFKGKIPAGVTAKDLVLELCGEIGTAGGTGCAFEFCGDAIKEISMEGAPDDLQHGDRSRRAFRPDCAGPDHDRLCDGRRPSVCSEG